MLFGMLRVAVVAWMRDSREPVEIQGKCSDLATSYRHRCIECLTHANYGRPEEFLLEALLFHLYAEFSASRDFHPDVWVLHGMVVRTSMRLGYHLDPCSLRDITPFQAEMRRRVWTFVRVSDILLSFQISLPSMVSPRWLAGALPRNLHDDDFHRQSDELPAARPDGETTRVSFLIHKAKLIFGFAKALDEIELSHCMTYTRVLKLDNELRSIYRSMPLQFQLHDLPDSPASDPLMASFRMVLGGIYHKALCVIHSKFLKSAATDQQYLYSWLGCIDSAMTLLAIQAFQHENFLVDGQVTALIHYQTSLTIHDFFLAATILCTTLFLEQTGPATEFPLRATAAPSRDKILQVLEKSMDIFDDGRGESAEASRACELLGALLYELRHPSRSQHDDTHLARAGSSNVAAQPPMSASSASTSLTNAGDMSSYQNVTSIPQLIGDNQGMRDIAQPFVSCNIHSFYRFTKLCAMPNSTESRASGILPYLVSISVIPYPSYRVSIVRITLFSNDTIDDQRAMSLEVTTRDPVFTLSYAIGVQPWYNLREGLNAAAAWFNLVVACTCTSASKPADPILRPKSRTRPAEDARLLTHNTARTVDLSEFGKFRLLLSPWS